MRLLASDIGATNSRFAIFEATNAELALKDQICLPTQEFVSIHDLLSQLQARNADMSLARFERVVLAVPGPVSRGKALLPNVPWNIALDELPETVCMLNDFAAQAYACLSPISADARHVKGHGPNPRGSVAVIGPGTGIGFALAIPPDDGRTKALVVPSELCHAMFPLVGETEEAFRRFLLKHCERPYLTPDLVVSAKGLERIHQFLSGEKLAASEIAARQPPETFAMYSTLFARICRQYCLAVMPTGGLFLTGGVAIKNPQLVENPVFLSEFVASPVLHRYLDSLDIQLFTRLDTGLWGAAYYALEQRPPRGSARE